ncbi:hypothetical protein BGZ50_002313 [Haplosporangium sp. Z 11]|nr:hypothetical protein BGZ50_002313 [Haplosporangium sp. Z 11]
MAMSWKGLIILGENATNNALLSAVKDPSTGDVYVPQGHRGTQMAIYRSNGTVAEAPMPQTTVMDTGLSLYSAVWSDLRGTLLLYGGINPLSQNRQGSPFLVEYDPRTNAWSRVTTKGPSPGNLYSHCMVPAYKGKMMVVFGGVDALKDEIQGDIYILDVQSMSWTKGTDIEKGLQRKGMACTAAGDSFVVWGGEINGNIPPEFDVPAIYNLKAGKWTKEFALVASDSGFHNGINGAAIGGGVAAAVLMLVAIGFFVYRRHKSKHAYSSASEHSLSDKSSPLTDNPKLNIDTINFIPPTTSLQTPVNVQTISCTAEEYSSQPPKAHSAQLSKARNFLALFPTTHNPHSPPPEASNLGYTSLASRDPQSHIHCETSGEKPDPNVVDNFGSQLRSPQVYDSPNYKMHLWETATSSQPRNPQGIDIRGDHEQQLHTQIELLKAQQEKRMTLLKVQHEQQQAKLAMLERQLKATK